MEDSLSKMHIKCLWPSVTSVCPLQVKFDDNNPFSEGFQERERRERLREQQERQRVQLMQEVTRHLQQRNEQHPGSDPQLLSVHCSGQQNVWCPSGSFVKPLIWSGLYLARINSIGQMCFVPAWFWNASDLAPSEPSKLF